MKYVQESWFWKTHYSLEKGWPPRNAAKAGGMRPCTTWLWGRGSSPKTQRCSSQSRLRKKKKNEKTLAFFHCTCLTVASIDIHYKYIYMYVYIHTYILCIYIILPFYLHIYYSQILNTQHMGARKGRQKRWTVCVHNFVLLQEHRKNCARDPWKNDYYLFWMSEKPWQQTFCKTHPKQSPDQRFVREKKNTELSQKKRQKITIKAQQ